MAKKTKPKRRKEANPTLFVFEGSIRAFEGSMLELYTKITSEEWASIVEDTIKYKVYVECLKAIAVPRLDEVWTAEDDWFRYQLGVAVSRMRNIDCLFVAKFNQKEIKKVYSEAMVSGAVEINKLIENIRSQRVSVSTSSDTIITDSL